MEVAYLILAHKNPEQLARLIHRLNTETTSFFVHFDKKSDDRLYQILLARLGKLPNVFFLKRHRVYWGDFSHLTAQTKGIEEILSSDIRFDYLIFLTGQDYPVKPNSDIQKTLRSNKPNSFMDYSALPAARWYKGGLDRIEEWHFYLFGRQIKFPGEHTFRSRLVSLLWSAAVSLLPSKREFPEGLHPFGGSAYWCLSRECTEYINDFVGKNKTFVNFFKYVWVPEEIFFQTIVLNSPFRSHVINRNLWYNRWVANSPHPAILRKNDVAELAKFPGLFARKFDVIEDVGVLDMIDRNLLGHFGRDDDRDIRGKPR